MNAEELKIMCREAYEASLDYALLSTSKKNEILLKLADLLAEREAEIMKINSEDVNNASKRGLTPAAHQLKDVRRTSRDAVQAPHARPHAQLPARTAGRYPESCAKASPDSGCPGRSPAAGSGAQAPSDACRQTRKKLPSSS